MERNLIAGIAADRNEARVTVDRRPRPAGHRRGGHRAAWPRPGIPVDMIVHAATPDTGSSDLTFTVPRASLAQAMAAIEGAQAQRSATTGW